MIRTISYYYFIIVGDIFILWCTFWHRYAVVADILVFILINDTTVHAATSMLKLFESKAVENKFPAVNSVVVFLHHD